MAYATREDGTKIYYEEHGEGFPLVLVIGLGGTSSAWKLQVPEFSKKYRVITLDNRGAGKSDKPDEPYSTAIFADDLKAVLDDAGIQKAAVLGLSMGGLIVQEFYHRYPEYVVAMVLGCTGVGTGDPEHVYPEQYVLDVLTMPKDHPNQEEMHRKKAGIFYHPNYIASIPNFMQHYIETIKKNDQPAYAYQRQLDACILQKPELWNSPRLKKIKVPVYVVHGDDDQIWPLATGQYLADNIPDAEFHIMPGAAHMMFIEMPDDFNAAVLSFLERRLPANL